MRTGPPLLTTAGATCLRGPEGGGHGCKWCNLLPPALPLTSKTSLNSRMEHSDCVSVRDTWMLRSRGRVPKDLHHRGYEERADDVREGWWVKAEYVVAEARPHRRVLGEVLPVRRRIGTSAKAVHSDVARGGLHRRAESSRNLSGAFTAAESSSAQSGSNAAALYVRERQVLSTGSPLAAHPAKNDDEALFVRQCSNVLALNIERPRRRPLWKLQRRSDHALWRFRFTSAGQTLGTGRTEERRRHDAQRLVALLWGVVIAERSSVLLRRAPRVDNWDRELAETTQRPRENCREGRAAGRTAAGRQRGPTPPAATAVSHRRRDNMRRSSSLAPPNGEEGARRSGAGAGGSGGGGSGEDPPPLPPPFRRRFCCQCH